MRPRPPDCLVIEDSVAGVEAARAAGMTAFGFVGASHFPAADAGPELTQAAPRSFSTTWRGSPNWSPAGVRRRP